MLLPIVFVLYGKLASLNDRLLNSNLQNYFQLVQSMENRFQAGDEYDNILSLFSLLKPNTWPGDVIFSPWLEVKIRLEALSKKIKYKLNVNEFKDLISGIDLTGSKIPPTVTKAKKIIKTIAVSSAEAERAFSLLNSIWTQQRNKLNISNISHLMSTKLMGLPLKE